MSQSIQLCRSCFSNSTALSWPNFKFSTPDIDLSVISRLSSKPEITICILSKMSSPETGKLSLNAKLISTSKSEVNLQLISFSHLHHQIIISSQLPHSVSTLEQSLPKLQTTTIKSIFWSIRLESKMLNYSQYSSNRWFTKLIIELKSWQFLVFSFIIIFRRMHPIITKKFYPYTLWNLWFLLFLCPRMTVSTRL